MSDNTVAWVEVATDDPDGGLFGWSFAAHGDDYRPIGNPGGGEPVGGLYDRKGDFPSHAVFHPRS
jgi:hypothetical protein